MRWWCHSCGGFYLPGNGCPKCRATRKSWSPYRDRGKQAKFRRRVLARDGNQCVVCGATEDLRACHIVPLVKGGGYEPANGRTLCRIHDRMTDRYAR